MFAIELAFLTGRYHATPWDQHANEGAVEWPPSPWRLLRALVATWYLKARDEIDVALLHGIIEALVAELPRYGLPEATMAHTRHYVPVIEGAKSKPFKLLDAFLQVSPASLVTVCWPGVALADVQRRAVALLLARLGYLGRAESLVEARVAEPGEANCFALTEDDAVDETEYELTRVLAPMRPQAYEEWRRTALDERMSAALQNKRDRAAARGRSTERIKLSDKEQAAMERSLPSTLCEALEADVAELDAGGWSRPPGTRWITYARPRDMVTTAPAQHPHPAVRQVTTARFALTSKVPPRLTDALLLGERMHRALMGCANGAMVFSGRAATGAPLEGHQHAYILAEANHEHGHVSHVTVYARMGLSDPAVRRALDRLTRIRRGEVVHRLVLLGVGMPEDFAGLGPGQCPLLAGARTWISRTPFVPTRHPKTFKDGRPKLDEHGRQIGSAEHELRRLLRESGFPDPVAVESVSETLLGGKPTRWVAFRTRRRTGNGRRAVTGSYGFRITFPAPVAGPIALGYGAHFGLGVFVPG